jgi:hypothetical protein
MLLSLLDVVWPELAAPGLIGAIGNQRDLVSHTRL